MGVGKGGVANVLLPKMFGKSDEVNVEVAASVQKNLLLLLSTFKESMEALG